jgi:alpha-L-fucosidase
MEVQALQMKTRREFLQSAAQTATAAMLANNGPGVQQSRAYPAPSHRGRRLLELQERFVNLRLGMFLHFNMATFQDREWGDPKSPTSLFDPNALDTDQWAAAARSANMTWGCLTTRHHDGFCIWPTRTEAAHLRQDSPDIVRSYVDSFRKAGLRVALYYSILSLRDDIRHFNVTPAKVQLIKDQLTELFTNCKRGFLAVFAL